MNRYEALLEQFRQGSTELPDTWVICPKCLDAWWGKAGDVCMECGNLAHQTPLFPEVKNAA